MKKYFANLSLLERRFVVGVLVVLFIILNFMFVWPHFNDWSAVRSRVDKARQLQTQFDAEIAQRSTYEAGVKVLEKEGSPVAQEDQDIDLIRNIQNQSTLSDVIILSNTHQQGVRTNQFFVERIQNVTVQSGEAQLINFLYNLGSLNSTIRVRELSIRPIVSRLQLNATIKLVASYQKKAAARPGASPTNNPSTLNAKRP